MADYQTQFLADTRPYAVRVARALGTTPEIIQARWAAETGWGRRILPGTFNLGNITDFRKGADVHWAIDNGNRRPFRKFASFDDYATHEIGLLQRRYPKLQGVTDPMQHATILKQGGYAEAPGYAEHVGNAMYNSVLRRIGAAQRLAPNADWARTAAPRQPTGGQPSVLPSVQQVAAQEVAQRALDAVQLARPTQPQVNTATIQLTEALATPVPSVLEGNQWANNQWGR